MKENAKKILVIDDDDAVRETLCIFLTELGYNVFSAPRGDIGIQLANNNKPDLVITDYKMPDMDGLGVISRIKKIDEKIPIILITAFDEMDISIKAVQLGVYDLMSKPIEIERLKLTITKAFETINLSEKLATIISETSSEYQGDNVIIGKSKSIKQVFKDIGYASKNNVTVLIEGESGTGKELVARVIHYSGITKEHPFIAINCTAFPETLLESELFGHVQGSFTGAIRDKKGKFELAGHGTVFLDEISEMSPNMQAKLLRILQNREYYQVGGENLKYMNARVIAATNKNIHELVVQGKFREDLYYRLKVIGITLPPLRERKEDIPLLTVHLLKKINNLLHKNVTIIPFEVMQKLQNHKWEGNVRELENKLTLAVVLSKWNVLEEAHIMLEDYSNQNLKDSYNKLMSLAEVEKMHIKFVLDSVKWNKPEACKILQVSKPTLYKKIEIYQLKQNNQ